MKRYLNTLLIIGVTLVLVVLISWFGFPGWQNQTGGFLILFTSAIVGIVSLIKGILEINELLNKSKHENDKGTQSNSNASSIATSQTFINISTDPDDKKSGGVPQIAITSPVQKVANNLPNQNYGIFIGREKEIKDIIALLRPYPISQHSIISIHGIGGIGKSALALRIAYWYANFQESLAKEERFAAIVWVTAKQNILTSNGIKPVFHHFEVLQDIYRDIAMVLEWDAINRNPPELQSNIVFKALTSQRTLLIIDNLETIDDEDLLSFIRSLPAPTKAIVTTRHSIDVAYQIELSEMPYIEAKKIINEMCKENEVDLSNDEKRTLYNRTGGVPLAIVWAISLMGTTRTFPTVIHQLGQPNSDIASFCFDLSWAYIEGKLAASVLMLIALFDTGASREQISQILNLSILDRDESLSMLYRLALVNKHKNIFSLLPMTKDFVFSKIISNPEAEYKLKQSFINYYITCCQTYGGEKWLSYTYMDVELKNIQNAFKWAHQMEMWVAIGKIADNIMEYLDRRGMWREMVEYAKVAVIAAQKSQDPMLEARHKVYGLGWITAIRFGKHQEGLKSLQEGKVIAEAQGDLRECAIALRNEALIYRYMNEYDLSMELLAKSLDLSNRLGEHRWEIRAIGSMGTTEQARGNYDLAVDYYEKALKMAEENNDLEQIALNLRRLAKALIRKKEFEKAIDYAHQSIEIYKQLNSIPEIGDSYIVLGRATYLLDWFDEAKKFAEEGYKISLRLGYPESLKDAEKLLELINLSMGM